MSKSDVWGVLMVGTPGVLLAIAAPQLPSTAKVVLWLLYAGACIAWIIRKHPTLRRWRGLSGATRPMTLGLVIALGATVGAFSAMLAWSVFPPENTDDLPIQFMAQTFGRSANYGRVELNAEITNKSEKNVSLWFLLMIQLPPKDGKTQVVAANGRWSTSYSQPAREWAEVINVNRETTAVGYMVFDLPELANYGVTDVEWAEIGMDRMRLRIEDKVSGTFVLSNPMFYPSDPPAMVDD